MPESLSSFLVSVAVIVAVILCIPFIESVATLFRRKPQRGPSELQGEAAKVFSREVASDLDTPFIA